MTTTDQLIVSIRKRHSLADDVQIGVKTRSADMAVDEADSHKFTATITTDAIDRDDEVLLPDGMIASEFERSGALFWAHDYNLPVGIPGKLSPDGRMIRARGTFMRRPDDYVGEFFPDFARAFVTQMVGAGLQPGVSIGFIPIDSRNPSKKDIERYGSGIRRVISRWKLLEWSIAPVQSNPEAVVTAVGKGLIDPRVAKAVCPTMKLPKVAAPKPAPVALRKVVIMLPEIKAPRRVPVPVDEIIADEVARGLGKIYR